MSRLESFFVLRQTRYLSEMVGSNELAELDLYLRRSHLRMPVLEVLGSDGFRLSIAERVAKKSQPPPLETMQDLVAGALAQRDIDGAIRLLENKKDRGSFRLWRHISAYLPLLFERRRGQSRSARGHKCCCDQEGLVCRLAVGKTANRFRIPSP